MTTAAGSSSAAGTATPLMQQYREIKARHTDAILFFRMGDFYEMFYEDAEIASRALGLTLTSRNNGGAAEVPLAGVPAKALNEYLRRLVQQGFRVAICEQVEDPKLAKGVVKREVVETVTPGAVFADDLLDSARANFIASVGLIAGAGADARVGVAAADLSTGQLQLYVARPDELEAVLARVAPRELVVTSDARGANVNVDGALVTAREPWEFDPSLGGDELARQFGVHTIEGLGLGAADATALGAAGALLRYLRELQPAGMPHLARPVVERPGGVMPLDEMTRRNLELVESLRGGTEGTLLSVLDRTQTPMGARLLRQWLLAPLTDRARIDARLDAVASLHADGTRREALREALDGVRDIERLAGKVAANRCTPRELGALAVSLSRLPEVESVLRRLVGGRETGVGSITQTAGVGPADTDAAVPSPPTLDDTDGLAAVLAQWDSCAAPAGWIQQALVERPPLQIGDEATIAAGVDEELDALRALRDGGKDAIAGIQEAERARTGVASLKVGFNRVFGYFIEVSNANRHLVPADYQRRQTLTGGERYVTPALKEYEERVLTAADRIETRERELFEQLRLRVAGEVSRLQCAARAVAELDVYAALADAAAREGYVRPTLTDAYDLAITAGRHPVVERMMPRDKFIPNDVALTEDARIIILTGPNMAGKSTILRQIGLIALMAQTGSFVPASSATLGVVDRVFTRVGASDNLVRGQSTFMVEMSETSAILNGATLRSLVLLDEIGRGTSTYDGVSIAWAVTEHLHDRLGCKTVFATHYHELVQLADTHVGVRNFNVAVREAGDRVLFLHRLQPGGADRSYGIEVGRLAGLPVSVLARAREILASLEAGGARSHAVGGGGSGDGSGPLAGVVSAARSGAPVSSPPTPDAQLAFFSTTHPTIDRLRTIDANTLTPLAALTLLATLVDEARRE